MITLDYTALRPDGHTISQLRGYILVEQKNIADLESRVADCRECLAHYISYLSQAERDQLVLDQPHLFPHRLPNTEIIPHVEKQAVNNKMNSANPIPPTPVSQPRGNAGSTLYKNKCARIPGR